MILAFQTRKEMEIIQRKLLRSKLTTQVLKWKIYQGKGGGEMGCS